MCMITSPGGCVGSSDVPHSAASARGNMPRQQFVHSMRSSLGGHRVPCAEHAEPVNHYEGGEVVAPRPQHHVSTCMHAWGPPLRVDQQLQVDQQRGTSGDSVTNKRCAFRWRRHGGVGGECSVGCEGGGRAWRQRWGHERARRGEQQGQLEGCWGPRARLQVLQAGWERCGAIPRL